MSIADSDAQQCRRAADAETIARAQVDAALAELGRTRDIGLVMTGFGPAALSLEVSDMILTCPARVANALCHRGMVTMACPVAAPPSMRSLDMVWHERLGRHPAHAWLRTLIMDVAASG